VSLALHVLGKDIRRFRVLLALWVLPLLITLLHAWPGGPARAASGDIGASGVFIWIVSFLSPVLLWLLLLAMIPLVIQEEPTVGSTAFWLTRPVSGFTVLLAKAAFIGGFLILALSAVEVAILRLERIPPLGLGLAAVDIVAGWLVTTMYLVVLAVLTQTFARFAITGAVLVVGYWLTASLLLGILSVSTRGRYHGLVLDSTLAASRGLVGWALVLALGGLVVTSQYVTRRTTWTRAGALLALVGIALVGHVWHWDFLDRRAPAVVPASVAESLATTVAPDSLSVSEPRSEYGSRPKRVVFGRLAFSGLAPGYVAQPEGVAGSLHLGATRVEADIPYAMRRLHRPEVPGRALGFGQWSPEGVERVLGGVRVVGLDPSHEAVPLVEVDDALYARHGAGAGRYSVSVSFAVKSYHVTGHLPLKAGERLAWSTGYVELTSITPQTDGIEVTLRETDVDLAWRKERYSQFVFESFMPWGQGMFDDRSQRVLYVLRLADRKTALWPGPGSMVDMDMEPRALASHLRRFPARFRYAAGSSPGAAGLDARALAGADLVRIEARDFGVFSKDLRVEAFRLPRP
jgi:hypothetical protein